MLSIKALLTKILENLVSLNNRFSYKNSGSLNDLKTAGLYFCDSPTDKPTNAPWTSWAVEVIKATNAVKQIAHPVGADAGMFTRRYDGSTWTDWVNVCPTNQITGNLSTVKYVAKPKGYGYGSFIILGTAGGVGAVALVVTINNSSISSIINLVTGAAWTSANFTVTYSVTNNVGYIGLKTTSTANSNITVIAG